MRSVPMATTCAPAIGSPERGSAASTVAGHQDDIKPYPYDPERAKKIARLIRTGNVHLNGAPVDNNAPFGGYKQSGNGREWGSHGLEEFLEVKAIMGYNAAG